MAKKRTIAGAEAEIAGSVCCYLVEQKWEVYKEVVPFRGGKRADIVARRGREIWVIECKMVSSFGVIEQATRWRQFAHRVSVAVPKVKDNWFFSVVCNHFGIGVLTVNKDGSVEEIRSAPLHRTVSARYITNVLREELKQNIAGSNGSYWTPFNSTVRNLKDYLKINPGATMKQAIDDIEHHYRSDSAARSSLSHWIRSGVIEGIKRERVGKVITLHLIESGS